MTGKMKGGVYHAIRNVTLDEVDIPQISENDTGSSCLLCCVRLHPRASPHRHNHYDIFIHDSGALPSYYYFYKSSLLDTLYRLTPSGRKSICASQNSTPFSAASRIVRETSYSITLSA